MRLRQVRGGLLTLNARQRSRAAHRHRMLIKYMSKSFKRLGFQAGKAALASLQLGTVLKTIKFEGNEYLNPGEAVTQRKPPKFQT